MTAELRKTLIFLAVAALSMGAAVLAIPDRSGSDLAFNDQGQPFFPDFKDPNAATDLEVVEFDAPTASARPFKVMFKDGRWVIPSHHNYPADAKDRLAKTAAGVIDLTKDKIASDRADEHEKFNVLDPLDPKAPLTGRGKRVTLRDKSEKVLADFIIGKEVEGRTGQRYVRVPGQKRTYGVNVKVDLSTRFADWIETNLLKVDAGHLREIKIDHNRIDPDKGQFIPGDVLTLDRKNDTAPWAFEGEIPAGSELNTEKISGLTSALADLKIVGVRPKPEGLSRDLKMASGNDVKPTTRQEQNSLVLRGFYPTTRGLYSNQGDVIAKTDEGAVYTLRFGEAVVASGEQLEAGGNDEPKGKDAKKSEGGTEGRYLMVTVAFDPSLVPEPAKAPEPMVIPDDPFQKAPEDPKRIEEEKKAKEKADAEKARRERQLADAEKKVKALSDRFADWYYVTPGDSFRAIALDRAALTRPKAEKPATGGPGAGDLPQGLPGGLPPGLSLPPGLEHP